MEQNNKDGKKSKIIRKAIGGAFSFVGIALFIMGFIHFSNGAVGGWYLCLIGMVICIVGGVIASVGGRVTLIGNSIEILRDNIEQSKKGDTVTIGDNDELYVRKCKNCGAQNKGTAKFCDNCGQPFSALLKNDEPKVETSEHAKQDTEYKICESCGGNNEKSDKFCRFCGKKL